MVDSRGTPSCLPAHAVLVDARSLTCARADCAPQDGLPAQGQRTPTAPACRPLGNRRTRVPRPHAARLPYVLQRKGVQRGRGRHAASHVLASLMVRNLRVGAAPGVPIPSDRGAVRDSDGARPRLGAPSRVRVPHVRISHLHICRHLHRAFGVSLGPHVRRPVDLHGRSRIDAWGCRCSLTDPDDGDDRLRSRLRCPLLIDQLRDRWPRYHFLRPPVHVGPQFPSQSRREGHRCLPSVATPAACAPLTQRGPTRS